MTSKKITLNKDILEFTECPKCKSTLTELPTVNKLTPWCCKCKKLLVAIVTDFIVVNN